MKNLFLIFVLLLSACSEEKLVLTADQQKYVDTLPLDQRIYFLDCAKHTSINTIRECMIVTRNYANTSQQNCTTANQTNAQPSSNIGSTIIGSAVGSAIGAGTVHLLTKKRK